MSQEAGVHSDSEKNNSHEPATNIHILQGGHIVRQNLWKEARDHTGSKIDREC